MLIGSVSVLNDTLASECCTMLTLRLETRVAGV